MASGVFKELDYHNEAANAEIFLKKHRFLPFITAPHWVPELTGPKGTARVLRLGHTANGTGTSEAKAEDSRVDSWPEAAGDRERGGADEDGGSSDATGAVQFVQNASTSTCLALWPQDMAVEAGVSSHEG